MNTQDLKAKVEQYRTALKDKTGKACFFSESGPASMDLIDALVATLEDQQRRIEELEKGATFR